LSKPKNLQNKKHIPLYKKIAKKLTPSLVNKLNKVIYNWVTNKKKQYPLNPYLRKLKAYAILMRRVDVNTRSGKEKYAKYLLGFVKYK